MNFISRVIATCKRQGYLPEVSLVLAMLALRGGQSQLARVLKDYFEWLDLYGPPTYTLLEYWADTLDVEADIAEASARSRFRSQDEQSS